MPAVATRAVVAKSTAFQFRTISPRISYDCAIYRECLYILSFVVLNLRDRESAIRNTLHGVRRLFEPTKTNRGILPAAFGDKKQWRR
jgi:hypothetical protein